MTEPFRPLGVLHLIADLDAFAGEGLLAAAVRPLLESGLQSLQLRGKGRDTADLVRAGAPLREEAGRHGCRFVVNGDADAARELRADGLHVPASAGAVRNARAGLPPGTGVGVSCHDADELDAARGADWVFLSPVFPTESKPGAEPLGPARTGALARGAPAPVYALGGVTADNATVCLRAGCAGVAAIRGLHGDAGLRLLRAALEWERTARRE